MAPFASKEFGIDELCGLTGLPKRTVRYYIQIGLVDRPEGETRAARYTQKHLEQLLAIRRWTQEGLSLERIRELLSGATQPPPGRPDRAGTVEVWSHLIVSEGVEVRLDPARAGLSPEQSRQFFAAVMAAFQQIKPEDPTA
ncbi:MerR family transcriptional regulator [Massilia sp.]|uniref:MerR family transcriptional regulator n=1 Tax=Massilia sp. TaxID=1882437 RepID=UPI00391D2597